MEIVSLLPEKYEDNKATKISSNSFIRFTFFEHSDYIRKYVTKKRYSNNPNKQHKIKYLSQIDLPLNTEVIRDQLITEYHADQYNFFPNLLYQSIQKHGGNINEIISAMKESVSNAGKKVEDIRNKTNLTSEAAQLAAGFAAQTLAYEGSDEMEKNFISGAKFAEGVAYNPNIRATFVGESQPPREFQFLFKLTPKSKKEVKNIRRAEYIFTTSALPKLWTGMAGLESKYINHFKYPKKVKIQVYIDNKPYERFKFLDSVIMDFSFNQNIDGSSDDYDTFIKDESGEIFALTFEISMTILETKIFTRNDAEEVY